MHIIKNIFLLLLALIAIALIAALFVKKDYTVEREITINKPKQLVFDYVKLLRNQDNFSKWASMDPNMKKDYKGIDGTVGFVSSWEGNKDVGKGEQTIRKITEGEKVEFDLHFIKPFEGLADAYMSTEALAENQTKVKWGLKSSMKYPMNLMLLFMNMDKMIGEDFQVGLVNLKGLMEK